MPETPEMPELVSTVYFEDIEIDREYRSSERLVTEADLASFTELSGDRHPIHVDEEYARQTRFGRRILHGPFGVAVALGLFGDFREFVGSSIALTDIREWTFKAPIFVGDRIHLSMRITAKRPATSGRHGVVTRFMRLVRHDGTVVQEGSMGLMIAARPLDG